MLFRALVIWLSWTILASEAAHATDSACLDLRATVSEKEVVERLPLVIRLTLTNTCESPAPVSYSPQTTDLMERWARLVARNAEGRESQLTYFGGPQASQDLPTPALLLKGKTLERECVRSLLAQKSPDRLVRGPEDMWDFLPPGNYTAHMELSHLGGQKIVSNEFAFDVLAAQGGDREARDGIAVRYAAFLEGRDRPLNQCDYDGRKLDGQVDVSRFGELQRILDEHPDSTYAEWVRYWKLYHHGPPENALEYAREHRDFPLSDNLMLHVAEGYFNGKDCAQARTVVEELLRDFPDGDTHTRAVELQQRLSKKP